MIKIKNVWFFCLFLVLSLFLTSCLGSNGDSEGDVVATPWETKEEQKEDKSGTTFSADEAFSKAEELLKDMSLDEKVSQIFLVNLESLDTSHGTYHNFTKVTKKMKSTLKKYPVGGVILESKNVETPEQLKKLISDLQSASPYTPLYVATVEAGGDSSLFAENSNLRGTVFPSYQELGSTKTEEEVQKVGETVGNELKEFGFNLNMAPTADVADEELNPAYAKNCFSSDTGKTGDYVKSAVLGMKSSGMGTVLKSFPGVGSLSGKIGEELVNNDNGLFWMREKTIPPFQAGVNAGADGMIVSCISVSKITQNTVPACMSELVIDGIIREELEFEGIVITDKFNSSVITSTYTSDEAALQALTAGADVIQTPEDLATAFKGVKEAVLNQSLDMRVLNEAVLRILQNKIMQGIIVPE